jgi:uncharacterized protein (DUF433 family)
MSGERVVRREGVYYVPGTRITLDSIVYTFREGCSPESIRQDFEGLTLANVYGAIAFYLDHQADIDRPRSWFAGNRGRTSLARKPHLTTSLESNSCYQTRRKYPSTCRGDTLPMTS